jgi:transposase
MANRRYKNGQYRHQFTLLPPSIEDYVSEQNPVRAIDAYIATLNLSQLQFKNTAYSNSEGQAVYGISPGQPAYDPAILLKLYLYGYLNRIHSSRRLEREAARNLEVIWLLENLCPGYKTIADFRKNNANALKAVNKDFVLLCRELKLFGGEQVGVDGSFFKGNTSKNNIYTAEQLDNQITDLEQKISNYQQQLAEQDARDDQAGIGSLIEDSSLSEKIAQLKAKQAQKKALQSKLLKSGNSQISTVDPDARLLSKNGQTTAGYNTQIAVDSKHKLLVAVEVTQDGNDSQQLMPMLEKAQEVLQSEQLTVLADAGYYNGDQLKQAEDQGISVYVPIPKTVDAAAKDGRFGREQFQYDEASDSYQCPQGESLSRSDYARERGKRKAHVYQSKPSVCKDCPLRTQCLSAKANYKKLERWEHQDVAIRHKERMKQAHGMMKKRASIVEHPFGTLKHRAGMHHFLMRGLEKCRGEFNLMALCYNFTRVMKILGFEAFRDYCAQRSEKTQENVKYA